MKKLTLTPQQKQWVKTNLFRPSFLLLSGLTEEEIEARLFSGIQAGELRRNFTKADLKVWIHREFISQIKTVPGDARDFFVPPNLEELVDTAREYFNTPPGDIAAHLCLLYRKGEMPRLTRWSMFDHGLEEGWSLTEAGMARLTFDVDYQPEKQDMPPEKEAKPKPKEPEWDFSQCPARELEAKNWESVFIRMVEPTSEEVLIQAGIKSTGSYKVIEANKGKIIEPWKTFYEIIKNIQKCDKNEYAKGKHYKYKSFVPYIENKKAQRQLIGKWDNHKHHINKVLCGRFNLSEPPLTRRERWVYCSIGSLGILTKESNLEEISWDAMPERQQDKITYEGYRDTD